MSRHPYRTAPDPNVTGWPSGVPYIIGNEGCERFSFYGMRAILYVYVTALFMNQFALLEDAAHQATPVGERNGEARQKLEEEAAKQATQVVHLFMAAVYAFPLIGAIIADRWWGKYRTILCLSLVYCLGNGVLAFSASNEWQQQCFGQVLIDPKWGCYWGLALIGIGSGGIKPCVSANVGDQFGKGNWHLLSRMFNAFYFIINFGSAFATIIIPLIAGDRYTTPEGMEAFRRSIAWAFAVPGILMGLATLLFWMGRRKFVHVPPSHPGMLGLLDVLSGTALFAVVGIPIFGHEFLHSWLWIGVGSAASLVLFVILFAVRQRVEPDDGFLGVLFYCCRALFGGREAPSRPASAGASGDPAADPGGDWLARHWFFGPAVARFGREAAEGPVAVLKIVTVFIFVSVFWALFDQHSSTWIRQAEKLDRNVVFSLPTYLVLGAAVGLLVGGAVTLTLGRASRWPALGLGLIGGLAVGYVGYYSVAVGFWGWKMKELLPSQIPAANPFMVMVLIPYTQFGLYPLMKRLGLDPTPLRRMTIGMLLAGGAFAAVAVLQTYLDHKIRVHVGWQLIAYGLVTVAEVMISITGLEFAYSQAPKRMKSVIMGFWLFNVTLGNVLVAYLAKLQGLPLATFFWLFAGLMVLAAVLFGIRAAFYTYQDYTQ